MNIAIDLTWLKPKKSGGVEAFIRNLLDGFKELEDKNNYYLMTAKDNENEFDEYLKDSRFTLIKCNTNANDVKGHLIWQTLKQYKVLKKYNIDLVFFPVYEMPLYRTKKYKTAVVIHDILAYHYKENFSTFENMWFRMAWKKCIKNADRVIAISDYTKEDLKKYIYNKDNIVTIHNPVVVDKQIKETKILEKYDLKENEYFYTISSLHKHKNLKTLIEVIRKIKNDNLDLPSKLVISGVSTGDKEEFYKMIEDIKENIILTGFVSNEERNELIKKCNCFLHPSIFEGFGMTPVEAKILGAKVITTNETAIPESTLKKCVYVDNPYDENDWLEKIKNIQNDKNESYDYKEYDKNIIARKYLDEFKKIVK